MTTLPQDTVLGNLTLGKVFLEFDEPRLFLCRNRSGQRFIAVWVDEIDDEEVWLYAPVSSGRLRLLRRGIVDLRAIFSNAEDGLVYAVSISDSKPHRAEPFASKDIRNTWLPKDGVMIGQSRQARELVPIHTELASVSEEQTPRPVLHGILPFWPTAIDRVTNLSLLARREQRNVLDFYFENGNYPQLSIRVLGTLLQAVQSLIDSIAASVSGSHSSQMVFAGSFLGSFGVRFASPISDRPSLSRGEALVLERFFVVLETISRGEFRELSELAPQATNRLRDLFKSTAELALNFGFDWGSSSPAAPRSVRVAQNAVNATLEEISRTEILERRQMSLSGRLVGINIRTRRFEFLDDNENKYTGEITIEGFASAQHATVNNRYEANIVVITEEFVIGKRRKVKHELEFLQPET